ncbi:unnamed protein product [Rhizoctonia solani]|uniref:SH3 domain-containing protein n=1 Tax=Rhizoctonia solani TaxID=456999 RepID=A0A8H3DU25_9AGAM|nr:unnamed protein product [Rhizoctonia solani]
MSDTVSPPQRSKGLAGRLRFRNPTRAFTMSARPPSSTLNDSDSSILPPAFQRGRFSTSPSMIKANSNTPSSEAVNELGVKASEQSTTTEQTSMKAPNEDVHDLSSHESAGSGSTAETEPPLSALPTQATESTLAPGPEDSVSDDGASVAGSRSPSRPRRQLSNLSRYTVSGSIRRISQSASEVGEPQPTPRPDSPHPSSGHSSPSSGHSSDDEEPLFIPGVYRALYPFEPEGTAEMALVEDQQVNVLGRGGGVGWVVVLKPNGEQGLVPEGYLELVQPDSPEFAPESKVAPLTDLQTEALPAVSKAPKPEVQATAVSAPKEETLVPLAETLSFAEASAPKPVEPRLTEPVQPPEWAIGVGIPGTEDIRPSHGSPTKAQTGSRELSPVEPDTLDNDNRDPESIVEPNTKRVQLSDMSKTLGLKEWGSSTAGPSMFAGYERLPGSSRKGEGKDERDNFSRNVSQQAAESVSQQSRSTHGINILCIDGGGVRGLSSLLLLREVMSRIESLKGEPVKPADWFDVIAGTGTGGVNACMLGKLGMSIEEAVRSYTELTETVFSNKRKGAMSSRAAYKSTALKESLQEIIRATTGDGETKMIAGASQSNDCNTLIFATLKDHMNASIPIIFRSYEAKANRAPNCAIWEALYATMAHPDFFKSIDIAENSLKYTFVGGELGNSNPLAHVLAEVRELYPGRYVSCIMSIGAGYAHTIRIPNYGRQQVSLAMRAMATDSERVAEEMARRFQNTTGVYFRFNVDQGIQDVEADDWEKLCRIAAHTQAYSSKFEVGRDMCEAAKAIHDRNIALAVECIDGRIQRILEPAILKKCPIPTAYYTGRTKEIQSVGSCIVDSADQQQVCVIYGLGGAGKSQLAFKVIEQNHNHWDHIIYVDASSRETIESALRDFARVNLKYLGAAHTVVYSDTLLWLQGTRDSWLLFFDGADDLHLDIRLYFPSSYSGSILITTRIEARAGLAKPPESVYHISAMDPEDASSLLLRVVNRRTPCESKTVADKGAADALVRDFGFLVLAIVHAGAYIAHSTGMSILDYRKIFLKKRQATLEKYKSLPESSKFDDYDKTVYTTWNMCYELLGQCGKHQAQELLWLIAFLNHDGITRAIFQRAAINIRLFTPTLPVTGLEKNAYAYLYGYLTQASSDDPEDDDNWAENSFIETVGDLAAYSLIEYDKKNAAYTIHVLVQDWARTVIPHERNISLERTASLLAISVGTRDEPDFDSHCFRIGLGPHVKGILSKSDHLRDKNPRYWEVSPNHAFCFANVFRSMELWREEEELRMVVEAARKQLLGFNHPATLQSTDDLAHNYVNQGQLDRAERLYNEVLEARRALYRNTHGEEHDGIHASKKYLASIYQRQGRLNEAVPFWEDVVKGYRVSKGGNNPETLACMEKLADVYCRSEPMQLEKADALRKDMLSLIPDSHRDKPMCMRKLAEVLELKEDWEAAETLLVQSQEALKIYWGERHMNAIAGQQHLYEFRVRRKSVPPVSCDSCTHPTQAKYLYYNSEYICKLVVYAFRLLLSSLAILVAAYLLPICFGSSR